MREAEEGAPSFRSQVRPAWASKERLTLYPGTRRADSQHAHASARKLNPPRGTSHALGMNGRAVQIRWRHEMLHLDVLRHTNIAYCLKPAIPPPGPGAFRPAQSLEKWRLQPGAVRVQSSRRPRHPKG